MHLPFARRRRVSQPVTAQFGRAFAFHIRYVFGTIHVISATAMRQAVQPHDEVRCYWTASANRHTSNVLIRVMGWPVMSAFLISNAQKVSA